MGLPWDVLWEPTVLHGIPRDTVDDPNRSRGIPWANLQDCRGMSSCPAGIRKAEVYVTYPKGPAEAT